MAVSPLSSTALTSAPSCRQRTALAERLQAVQEGRPLARNLLIEADFAGLVVQGVQKAGFLMQVDPNMNHGAWLLSLKAHSLVRESKPSAIPILSSGRIRVQNPSVRPPVSPLPAEHSHTGSSVPFCPAG